ncbi:hypothetical protein C6P40_004013 [Pichia californica]|uniref:RRM domain-containing protein n=1 Tax=Pichia californica TaxID=460514 RepID=A0A9P7BHE0_9ASCO|nr:hypothetical protein C6P42_002449 [[Candida] californica]KAG0691201.1 hypothetical protein C6P40_004013 [[Candida] californica]
MSDTESSTSSSSSNHKNNKNIEDIEINLNADTPLSKKELRRIKKGKTTLEKIQKKKAKKLATAASKVQSTTTTNTSTISENEKSENNSDDDSNKDDKEIKKDDTPKEPKRSDFGIWIGNLSFDTTRDELINFIISKSDLTKDDISRVNLPTRGTKNRGFAYIDFQTDDQLNNALKLSESELNGRKVLIKNSKSYEGRPAKPEGITSTLSKNPPSRILFVGNLSFDTSQELLQDHFKHCGEIIKIRMATFEDSGKCKGFAFIDFKDIDGPTAALKDKSCKKLIGRPLRLEFGEDRSQRKVIPKRALEESLESHDQQPQQQQQQQQYEERQQSRGFQEKQDKNSFKRQHFSREPVRITSSVALANAPRQSAAIVKSTGKKVTF